MVWSWEFGYYRGWDRHGYISDFTKTSPFGYKDPYGLDAPDTRFIDYYFNDWWNGPWLEEPQNINPPMHFGGYDKVNDGTAKPEDFKGPVIVVDQSGKGDARTIQEAVDKAQPETTIFVRTGTYRESVKLKEGICLWGENPHTTIINPDFTNSAIIAANNCDISGFTLTGTGMNYKEYDFSSGVHALDCDSTLVIRGNIFDSNGVFGVHRLPEPENYWKFILLHRRARGLQHTCGSGNCQQCFHRKCENPWNDPAFPALCAS